MQIAGIIEDDIVDCDDGICVSLWVSGCHFHCKGCQNEQLWDYNYGEDIPRKVVMEKIIDAIRKNGLERNFSILGGEPLDEENIRDVSAVICRIRQVFPKIKIYLWTGYTIEELRKIREKLSGGVPLYLNRILKRIDVLIDGPFIEELKDTNLKLKGSSNQRILYKKVNYNTRKKCQG